MVSPIICFMLSDMHSTLNFRRRSLFLLTLGLSLGASAVVARAEPLLSNPTFADADGDGAPDGWNAYPPGDGVSRILTSLPEGGLVFKDDDKGNGLGIEQWISVEEGKRYTASATVSGNGGVSLMMFFVREKPARVGDLKSVQLSYKSIKAVAGTTTELVGIAPAGAKWMKFWLYCPKIGVTDVVINKVDLKSDTPPASASQAQAQPVAGTETAGGSAAPVASAPGGNLLQNPTFADSGDGTPADWTAYPPGDGASRVLAPAPQGGLVFKDNDKGNGLGMEQWIDVQEGLTYTASATVSGNGSVSLMMIFTKEKPRRAGDLKAVQLANKSIRAEAGKTVEISAIAPAGARKVKFWLYCPKIGITDVVIEKAALTAAATSSAPAAALPAGLASVIDFETGDLSQAQQGQAEGGDVSVISSAEGPVRDGKYAAKIALRKDKHRAEVPSLRSEPYGVARYGWSVYMPEDFDANTFFSIITQWHSWGSGRESPKDGGPPTSITISKGEVRLKLLHQGDDGWTSKATYFPLGTVDDMRGKWTDWVMEVNWQPPGKDGWLKLYKNDRQVVDYQGTTWYEDKDKGPYFKFGIYKGGGKWKGEEQGAILYFDSARMALGETSTYKMVAPSTYSPRPGK